MAASNSPFQRRYPPEMRERAVRMVLDPAAPIVMPRVAQRFGHDAVLHGDVVAPRRR